MAFRFQLDPAGIAALLKSDELTGELERRVAVVAERAKETAPVDTGDYRDEITSGTFDDGDRTCGYVLAPVAYACSVESRDRTLGSALDAASESP